MYRRNISSLALVLSLLLTSVAVAEEWLQFRGPDQGRVAAKEVPAEWSDVDGKQKNVRWKTELPGRAWSSPVLADGKIWLTTATEDGLSQSLLAVDYETGKILFQEVAFTNKEIVEDMVEPIQSYASPTCVIDPKNKWVFAHFGRYGTACYDTQSHKQLWSRRDFVCNHQNGPGSSPILADGKLIFHVDGMDVQYIVALDPKTGKTLWKTKRDPELQKLGAYARKAYCTPVIDEANGKKIIISTGAGFTYGYDLATGKELWKFSYPRGFSNVPMPLFDAEHYYVNSGFHKPVLYAFKRDPKAKGNITESHFVWKYDKAMPKKSTPVLVDGRLFVIDELGIFTCLDAKTGEEIWRVRAGGEHSASVVATDKYLYIFSHEGLTRVYDRKAAATSKEAPKPVAINDLGSQIMATPAFLEKTILLRTRDALYRIEE